jgi:DNA repair protein RecO (recombination protein O)
MDMRVSDQAAFLLHRRDYQDSSLILEVLTRDYGRMGLLARGARKRRDVSHFQIANRLQLGWSGRSDLKVLTSIESRALEVPGSCMIPVFYLNELLMYLLPRQDANREIFELYQLTLLQLETDTLEASLRYFEYHLLTELGLMPELGHESPGGRPVEANSSYQLLQGSGLTRIDEGETQGFSGEHLLAIQAGNFSSADILKTAKLLMRSIIDFNLQGRALQSRQIYQQMMSKSQS